MTDIVKSVSIDNMLNQRAGVIERMGRALDLIADAAEMAAAANIGFPCLTITNSYGRGYERRVTGLYSADRDDLTEVIQQSVDVGAWEYLMAESGLRTFMDAKAREEWDKGLRSEKCPELTWQNVQATFKNLYGSRADMFERGVIACFRNLAWCYKTNRPFKFGKRIILRYLSNPSTGAGGGYGYPNHRTCDTVDDLLRIFHVLDGKPEPDHRTGTYHVLSKTRDDGAHEHDGEYVHLKWFRNGNGHLTFKRPDLVEKMNAILTKHYPGALPYDRNAGD